MKRIYKFLLTLCIMLGMFSMLAYASEGEEKAPFEYTEDEIVSAVQGIVKEISTFSVDELEYYIDNSLGFTKIVCENYIDYVKNDSLGEFVEFKDSSIENTESSVIVTLIISYKETDLEMKVTYKQIVENIVPTDVSMNLADNGNKSMLDKVKNAGLNTIMGLAVVFIMLSVISYLISLFKFIPRIQQRFEDKKVAKEAVNLGIDNAVAQIVEKEELIDDTELVNDTELVAVITAAICASTNASSDGFVVRSIRKRKFR